MGREENQVRTAAKPRQSPDLVESFVLVPALVHFMVEVVLLLGELLLVLVEKEQSVLKILVDVPAVDFCVFHQLLKIILKRSEESFLTPKGKCF